MKPTLILLLFALFCLSFQKDDNDKLRRFTWVLHSVQAGKTSKPKYVHKKVEPYLMFQDTLCVGHSGCNSLSAKYSLKKDSISFGIPRATEMYCEQTDWIEKAMFNKLMRGKSKFLIKGNKLIIYARESYVFTFLRNLKK